MNQYVFHCIAAGTFFWGSPNAPEPVESGPSSPVSDRSAADPLYVSSVERVLSDIASEYAYFEEVRPRWADIRRHYLLEAGRVRSEHDLFLLCERLLEELCDDHAELDSHSAESPRNLPSGSDLWPVWDRGRVVIESVRASSSAEAAGLRGGMEIVMIDGVPAAQAVLERVPPFADRGRPRVLAWSTRAAVAGRRDQPIRLTVREGDHPREIVFEPDGASGVRDPGEISHRFLDHNIGLIRFHNSLGEDGTVDAFDAALADMGDIAGLIIDLRDTASGGNTNVARGVMSRFVPDVRPYQIHEYTAEARATGVRRLWVEQVAPRDRVLRVPISVLVSRWTGSMGEGLAIGLRSTTGAVVVGTPMSGLRGAVSDFAIEASDMVMGLPTETLASVEGFPREQAEPDIAVDPSGMCPSVHAEKTLAAGIRSILSRVDHGEP